jgi:hypothetical protein
MQGVYRVVGGAIAAVTLLAAPAVQAVGDDERPGLGISPAFSQVTMKTTASQALYEVTLTNHSEVSQLFVMSAADFGSLDEEGGVAFLGQSQNLLDRKYGLAAWMKLDKTQVTVPAGGSAQVRVTIDNASTMSPGGHYGAVLATAQTDGTGKTGRPRVGVKQVLSSLILLVKDGGARPTMALVSQTTNAVWWRLPTSVTQRFKGTGNVHIVPRGTVEVVDPLGRVVRRGALNAASGAVLPESIRRYRTSLDSVNVAWVPGPYRVVASFRPDSVDTVTKQTTVIWFAGALVLWVVALAAVLLVWGLAWWLWWRPRHLKRHSKTSK